MGGGVDLIIMASSWKHGELGDVVREPMRLFRQVDEPVLDRRRLRMQVRRFVLGWKMFGLERTLGTRLVTYADDLVILCRRGKAEAALQRLREIMGKLKLTLSEEKTRICRVPEGEFDFLGYTFGRMFSARTGQARIGRDARTRELRRSVSRIRKPSVSQTASRRHHRRSVTRSARSRHWSRSRLRSSKV